LQDLEGEFLYALDNALEVSAKFIEAVIYHHLSLARRAVLDEGNGSWGKRKGKIGASHEMTIHTRRS